MATHLNFTNLEVTSRFVITRSNSQIIPISCKNTVTKQSIRYIGPKTWNELPEKIKLCKSLSLHLLKNQKHSSLNNNQTNKLLRRSSFNIFCWSSFSCVSGKQLNNLKIFNSTTVKKRLKKSSSGSLLFLPEQFF